jgi:hypothetical protein
VAERPTPISIRGAGLCLLAALLGALAGARWQRGTGFPAGAPPVRPAGFTLPSPVIELEPKVQGPVPIRSDSRNLFSFAESPQEKERRLDLERLAKIAADKKHQEELVQQKRQAGTYKLLELGYDAATIGFAEALVASHAEWAGRKTVLRMGAR